MIVKNHSTSNSNSFNRPLINILHCCKIEKLISELTNLMLGKPTKLIVTIFIVFVSMVSSSNAATLTSAGSGNWTAGATWVGGVAPVTGDIAIIANGHTVTLNATSSITSITINTGGILDVGVFQFNSGVPLTLNGTLRTANPNGLLATGGSFPSGTITFGTSSTTVFNGASTQTVDALPYRNLTLSNNAAQKVLSNVSATFINGLLTIDAGVVFNKNTAEIWLAQNIVGSGTLSSTGGILRFDGTVSNWGILHMAAAPNNTVERFEMRGASTSILTLGSPLQVSNRCLLFGGRIVTTTTNIFELLNTTVERRTWNENPQLSYIDGPVRFVSTSTGQKQITVGKNNQVGLVYINPNSSATTIFEIEYYNGVNIVPNQANIDAVNLNSVYTNQYYRVDRISGSANYTLQFYYREAPTGGTSTQTVALANYNGTQWTPIQTDRTILANTTTGFLQTTTSSNLTGLFCLGDQRYIQSAQNGNWNNTTTWVGGIVPTATQSVRIMSGHTVSVTANAPVSRVEVQSGAQLDFTTNQLTGMVSGLQNYGTVLTANSNGLLSSGSVPAMNTINSFMWPGSRVTYYGGASQTVNTFPYEKLTINNSAATKTLNGNTTIADTLTINALCTLNKGGHNLTLNGAVTGTGNLQSTGGIITIGGNATTATLYGSNITNTSLILNRNGGLTPAVVLAAPAQFTQITLNNGILQTDSINLLTVSTSIIGSSQTYIDGPVQVNTTSTNTIGITLGKAGVTSNFAITPTQSTNTNWRLSYINGAVPNSGNIGAGLLAIGSNQYWTLSRNTSNQALIQISFSQSPGGLATQTLRLANYTTQWNAIALSNNNIAANRVNGALATATIAPLSAPSITDIFAIGIATAPTPTTIVSAGSGNWSNPSSWSPAQVPQAGDNVTILNGHTIAVDISIAAGNGPASLIVNTGGELAVNDGVTFNNSVINSALLDNILAQPAVAFGMRRLRSRYTGAALRVRRTDNAEQDIQFDANGNLNQTALLSFANGQSLFVTTWYDQSGNGLNFTQSTAARQPRIVNNGVMDERAGIPAIRHFAANSHHLTINAFTLTAGNPWTVNVVQGLTGGANGRMLGANNNWFLGSWNGSEQAAYFVGWPSPNPLVSATNTNQIYTGISYVTAASAFRNGVQFTAVALPNPPSTLTTSGYLGSSEFSNGTSQEIIAYGSALSASERQLLETSQTNYYINGIIPTPSEGITINGTLRILHSGGLDSAIQGLLPSFGTNATIVYGGANQQITPIIASNMVLAGTGTKTLAGQLTVSASFTIDAGVVFQKDTHTVILSGPFVNNGSMRSTGGVFDLSGTGNVQLGFASPDTLLHTLRLNRTGTHTLTSPLAITNTLALNAGILTTTLSNRLTVVGPNVLGGSSISYVNGPVIIVSTTSSTKRIAVGSAGVHSIVNLQPQNSNATQYLITYNNGSSITPNTASLGAGITGVSANQYWQILRSGSTPADAVISVSFNSNAGGLVSNQLALASYGASGPWNRNGIMENIFANAASGTITTQGFISNFGDFALGYAAVTPENGLDSLGLTAATASAAAFSLRKLRSAYNGAAIRVRRSSDQAEQNIFFMPSGIIDTAVLKAFVGSANAFVTIWYDQSGNQRNAVQTDTLKQPSIVTAGVINGLNGRPTLRFDGIANATTGDGLLVSNLPTQTGTSNSVFWIQRTSDGQYMPLYTGLCSTSGYILAASNGDLSTDILSCNQHTAGSFIINGANTNWNTASTRNTAYQALNGLTSIVTILHQPLTWNGNMHIGGGTIRTDAWMYAGDMSEIVITNTTLSTASLIAVENNMGNYYSIATPNNGWVSTATGGNWNDAATWVQGSVPPAGASVTIATTGSNEVVLNTTTSVATLVVNANARLQLGNSNTITAVGLVTTNGVLITGNPNGLLGATASINGTIQHNVGSTVIYNGNTSQSISAATYRNLTIQNNAAVKTTAGTITVLQTLLIETGVILVQGNASHTITFSGSIGGAGVFRPIPLGTLVISGTSGGNIGTLNIDVAPNHVLGNITINRTGSNPSITLGSNLQVNAVNLTSGILNTSTSALLIMNNASTTNGSLSSYIEGPVQLINPTVGAGRVLHVGKSGFLGTVTLVPNTASSIWRVEYFNSTPTPPTPISAALSGIVNNQFWSVTKVSAPVATATVTVAFNIAPGGTIDQPLVLANYSAINPQWTLVPVNTNTLNGTSANGSLQASAATSFNGGALSNTDFTIGFPAPWQSVSSGNWRNGSTWSVGTPPNAGSTVRILNGHTVTVDTTIATAGTPARITINNGGILAFNATNTIGTVGNGIIVDGTLATAHASGINTSIGGTITYNSGSTLLYNGANQSIPTTTVESLTIAGSGTKTLTGAVVIESQLAIQAGVTLAKAGQSLTLNGTINNLGTFTSTGGSLILGGSLGGPMGTFNMTGTVSSFTMRRYGASPSVTIGSQFQTSSIAMENGLVTTDSTNTIVLTGTTTNQGSSSSFINGPLRINQNTTSSLVLPVGKLNNLGTITLIPSSGLTSWMVEYFATSPADTTTDTSALGSISRSQYWSVRRVSGSSTATLRFNFNISPNGSALQGITLARYTGSAWTIQSTIANALTGASLSGTISTPSGVNQFGDFAIGYFAQEFVSASSGNWNNPATWISNTVPTAIARVTIKPSHIVTLTTNAAAQAINIEAGGTLNLQTNQIAGGFIPIHIDGSLQTGRVEGITSLNGAIPNGDFVFDTGSELVYNGTSLQQLNAGTYRKLRSTNPVGFVINGTVTINDSLIITAGEVQLGTGTLVLNGAYPTNNGNILNGSGTGNLVLANPTGAYTLRFNQNVLGTSNRLRSLTINSSGSTYTVGNRIEVTDNITPTTGTLQSNGNLVLVSNAAGTAYTENGAGSITGNAIVQRYIPSIARRWRFVSSPVQSTTIEDWRNETHITGPGTGTTIGTTNSNGFDATSGNVASIFSYNETIVGATNLGWTAPTNTSQMLAVGRGYRLFIRGDRSNTAGKLTFSATPPIQDEVTLDAVGVLNSGNISIPVSCTFSGPSSTYADTSDGWNLIGNPYPGPFNWNTFYDANIGRTNIGPSIWVFDPLANSYKFYNALSNTGNITNGIVASGQAFWVKATNNSPLLTFQASNRVSSSSPSSGLFKTVEGSGCSIKLIRDSINSDEMFIKYLTGSTELFDDYDVQKIDGSLSISAWGTDQRNLSLTCRPLTQLDDTIFLNVKSYTTGTHTLVFENTTDIAIQDYLTLVDTYLNTYTNLNSTPTYPFQIDLSNPLSYGKNRFYIIVSTNNPVPVELLSFDAQRTPHNEALLTWTTAIEQNTSHFEAQWSEDNQAYKPIGSLKAAGESSVTLTYRLLHTDLKNHNYYRIKMVDKDGKFKYSPTRYIGEFAFVAEEKIMIWPVPSKDMVHVESKTGEPIIEYTIYSIQGNELYTKEEIMGPKTTIDLSDIEAGVYVLRLKLLNGGEYTHKLIKGE